MEAEVIRRNAAPVPRYTSYPTAPHFAPAVDGAAYRGWLEGLAADAALSLYCHVPFCDTLCWFCGCHTKVTHQYAPVAGYLATLVREIEMVGRMLPSGPAVRQLHWGGGSPTVLEPADIRGLADALWGAFSFDGDAEFSVEVDPRHLGMARIEALVEAGITRVSLGVQDFDPEVQQAINRLQSFEETARVVDAFRSRGVRSVNIDLLYGLPKQTQAALEATITSVLALAPDRIALFGYAHVPWMKTHQSMISDADLPDVVERFAQAGLAAGLLVGAGYERVGLDHFALPGDALAQAAREGRLRRNFQGYTADAYDALIGLGASAIGRLPNGYVQNEVATGRYRALIASGRPAVVRGVELSGEDRVRAYAIERLMCDLRLSRAAMRAAFGPAADPVLAEADAIARADEQGFVEATADGIVLTEAGRPFVRTVCAGLDTYLRTGTARHSIAV